jgi:thiol-disulfide isomerase/thioredoxin
VELFSGALLLLIGCLVFFNRLTWLTGKLIFLSAITTWLERPFAAAQHSWTFWLLVALSFIAVAALALVRYREVLASMQGKKTIAVLFTVVGFIALTIFADRATRVHNGNPSAIPVASAASIKPAPDIRLKDLDGKDVSLADYQGKVVFVNFWATWCDPCRVEIPWLIDLQSKYASKGFTVVGIAMDDEGKSVVAPFIAKERFEVNGQKLPMDYPIWLGTDDASDKFGGILGYPTSYLISRDGKQVMKIQGLKSYDELAKAIESQL